MFEFQTAISELTALPVANTSLYEGPSSVASAAYLALGVAKERRKLVVSRGLHPHSRATLGTYAHGFGAELVEVGARRRPHRPRRARRRPRHRDRRRLRPEPELPRCGRGPRGARDRRPRRGRALRRRRSTPLDPRRAAPAGRVRGRRSGRRGPAARQPARLRRAVVRVLRRHRGAPAPDARPDRRRDHRRRRAPRLRARAADPRAAHPPREGDPQHLHLAGAERARRHDLPRLARPARDRRARRAARPADRLRARAARRGRRGRAAARGAGRRASSRCGSTAPVAEVLDRVSEEGIAAGYELGREYPEYEDGLLVAITERRSKEDIDRLADALGRAIAAADGAVAAEDASGQPPRRSGERRPPAGRRPRCRRPSSARPRP